MTYSITNPGLTPGPSRTNVTRTVSSPEPNPIKLGLENRPQEIWAQLVNRNVGVFAQANPPAPTMTAQVPYRDKENRGRPVQLLAAYADGFGVA
jgi:hypothetical protein